MRSAEIRSLNDKWFVDMLEIEDERVIYQHTAEFPSEAAAIEARLHFITEYSGFDTIGVWDE